MRNNLLISGLLLIGAIAAAQTRSKPLDPDMKEIRDYRLSMDAIQRYFSVVKTAGNDPLAKKCFANNPPGNAPTLDAGEKIINACPAAVVVMKAGGLKPREFLILTGALIGDFTAVGMKKSGTLKQYPDSVSPENAAFVEQNYDKLQAMFASLPKQ